MVWEPEALPPCAPAPERFNFVTVTHSSAFGNTKNRFSPVRSILIPGLVPPVLSVAASIVIERWLLTGGMRLSFFLSSGKSGFPWLAFCVASGKGLFLSCPYS
jgi:hypothetical protein